MKKLVIIDLSNIIYRAFFGLQQPLKTPEGVMVNAVYGTFNMIYSMISDLKPDSIVAALDSRKSDRKEEYAEYKSNRSKMPDDLRPQIPMIHDLLTAMNIQMVEEPGLEADDLIYSLVEQGKHFDQIFIISGDKDLMQLVNDQVKIYDTMKQKTFNRESVFEKFGVSPEQIVDYLSIVGDASDCIPGVNGIGDKGAAKLLATYGSLDKIYEAIETIKPDGLKAKLIAGKESAYLSQNLAKLRLAKTSIEILPWVLNKDLALAPLTKWNMKSAIAKIKEL